MNRTVRLEIDRSSWPVPGDGPAFPRTFKAGTTTIEVNIPLMMLVIGFLTTPTASSGISLNEYWAWLRYFNATTNDPDLRIADDFAALDAHQKTILSDDFGMGLPMYWLTQALQLQTVSDGRYFIQRLASEVGATTRRTAKRGPNKSPDFVAKDVRGIWHIIECKGTQTSDEYREVQLRGTRRSRFGGAQAQKRTIIFPEGYEGQSLACGVLLGGSDIPNGTTMKIIDPPPRREKPFEIEPDQIDEADVTASRSMLATSLRMAGFNNTAYAVASPLGEKASTRPAKGDGKRETARKEFVARRQKLSEEELNRARSARPFTIGHDSFIGREIALDLPRPILIAEQEVRSVTIKQGVSTELVDQLRASELTDEGIVNSEVKAQTAEQPIRLAHEGREAQLKIGHLFAAEIELGRR